MNDQSRLRDALTDRAGDVAGSAVRFADVRGRARSIRRRRTTAGALAAAAVLAVVVPTGLTTADRLDRGDPRGGIDNQSSSPAPAAAPLRVRFGTDVPATGPAPAIPYVLDGRLVMPGREPVPIESTGGGYGPSGLAVLGGDLVTVTFTRDSLAYALIDPGGQVRDTWDSMRGPDSAPAWVTSTRRVSSGHLVTVPPGSAVPDPQAFAVSSRLLAAASPDGRYAQIVRRSDFGSCSALFDAQGQESWRTCDYTLGMFSPDGRYLIGRPAYLDGLGDAFVAVLDAGDGRLVARFGPEDAASQQGMFVGPTAWDTDGTLLTQVWDGVRWRLLRLTTDGQVGGVAEPDLTSYTDETSRPLTMASAGASSQDR